MSALGVREERRVAQLVAVVVVALVTVLWPVVSPASALVRVGAATLVVSSDWRVEEVAGSTAVLARADGVSGRMVVGFGPASDRTLVPTVLGARVTGAPRASRLGGYTAWSYGDVVVLPSGAGVLAVACRSGCASAVKSVSVRDAAILVPTADTAFALASPPLLAGFDRDRVRLREDLHAARSRSVQVAVARSLAEAHGAVAERLRTFAGPAGARLLAHLDALTRDYTALAAVNSRARFEAVRGEVDAADAELVEAVGAVASSTLLEVQRARFQAAPPAAPNGNGPWLFLALLPVAIVTAVVIARRRNRPPAVAPAPEPAVARPPAAPLARWDTPPAALAEHTSHAP